MEIIGQKIVLRDWQEEDLKPYRLWNTDHHAWMDWDAPYFDRMPFKELSQRLDIIWSRILSGEWATPRMIMVIAEKESNRFLGVVTRYWTSQETNWMSTGLTIYDEQDWDKGFGTEAYQLWISYLFENDPSLVRLDYWTWSGNNRMMRLGEKLGFKEEARFRKARIVKGEYYDSITMGVLREEWESKS